MIVKGQDWMDSGGSGVWRGEAEEDVGASGRKTDLRNGKYQNRKSCNVRMMVFVFFCLDARVVSIPAVLDLRLVAMWKLGGCLWKGGEAREGSSVERVDRFIARGS